MAHSLPETGFLRLKDVLELIPVCKSSWHAGVLKGKYPPGVLLGPRTRAYRVEDIRALVASMGQAA